VTRVQTTLGALGCTVLLISGAFLVMWAVMSPGDQTWASALGTVMAVGGCAGILYLCEAA
jgi:hypothetical protein